MNKQLSVAILLAFSRIYSLQALSVNGINGINGSSKIKSSAADKDTQQLKISFVTGNEMKVITNDKF